MFNPNLKWLLPPERYNWAALYHACVHGELDFDVGEPYTNAACLRDGIPCAPNGDGGCVACDFVAQ